MEQEDLTCKYTVLVCFCLFYVMLLCKERNRENRVSISIYIKSYENRRIREANSIHFLYFRDTFTNHRKLPVVIGF